MTSADGVLSPESTVTSLFARSGHLKSSFHAESIPSQSIFYKDRSYESASEALDEYIADFQKSQVTSRQCTGQLRLPKTHFNSTSFLKSRSRNRDVLKESLTDQELDFLNLPVGPQRRDPDRLSLTTDDLLVLPCDGSMPVTRTSALLSQCNTLFPLHSSCPLPHLRASSRFPAARCRPRSQHKLTGGHHHVSRSATLPTRQRGIQPVRSGLSTVPKAAPRPTGGRARGSAGAVGAEAMRGDPRRKPRPGADVTMGPQALAHSGRDKPDDTSPFRHYPRWMTSQKSEMNFSGITSVPELKYPAWLQECDPSGSTVGSGEGPVQTPYPTVPSWLGELEESLQGAGSSTRRRQKSQSDPRQVTTAETLLQDQSASQGDPLSLRELQLQFTDQLTLEEDKGEPEKKQPFRDDNIESLIQRAETALNSPTLGLADPQEVVSSPGGTEEVLQADRSWDNPPVTFKSPVPVGVSATPQKSEAGLLDSREKMLSSGSSGYSSRKHPGPVEALKQMLFSLQAVEHKVALVSASHPESSCGQNPPPQEPLMEEVIPASLQDQGSGPGGESLQRALHHLGRLKHLVDDMKDKKEKEQEIRRSPHVT